LITAKICIAKYCFSQIEFGNEEGLGFSNWRFVMGKLPILKDLIVPHLDKDLAKVSKNYNFGVIGLASQLL
jgi:hypothetical protein